MRKIFDPWDSIPSIPDDLEPFIGHAIDGLRFWFDNIIDTWDQKQEINSYKNETNYDLSLSRNNFLIIYWQRTSHRILKRS